MYSNGNWQKQEKEYDRLLGLKRLETSDWGLTRL